MVVLPIYISLVASLLDTLFFFFFFVIGSGACRSGAPDVTWEVFCYGYHTDDMRPPEFPFCFLR